MATILTDNFNSYNDGNLNGQGSWSGDTDFDVQGATVKEGAKAITGVDATTSYVKIDKTGTAQTDGKQTMYMRKDTNSVDHAYFTLTESGTIRIQVNLRPDGNISYHDGGAWVTITTYNANQWYGIEIEWRSSDKNARYKVNGGAWTNWDTVNSAWTTNLDGVQLATNQSSATAYFDYIAEEPLSVDYNLAVTVGVFTLTGIVALFIKALTMAVTVGAFTLTGVAATLSKAKTMIASVATFILTGVAATLTYDALWENRSKSTVISPTNLTKNDISPTNLTKNDISPTNQAKT